MLKKLLLILSLLVPLACGGGVVGGPADHTGHTGMGMPEIDVSKLAATQPGYAEPRVMNLDPANTPPSLLANPSDIGSWRTTCSLAKMAFDDPIVFPNQPGRSHLHTFFGNVGVDSRSTAESLLTSGNSTCFGGIVNRSVYWVSSMIDMRTGAPLRPITALIYYKQGYSRLLPTDIKPVPLGLRMIAGDAKNSVDVKVANQWAGSPYTWKCMDMRLGYAVKEGQQIPNCAVGNQLWQVVSFPQCWNGVSLDSPDHKSHMSYLKDGLCPQTHPVALPEITYQIEYAVTEADSTLRWRLSSDMYDEAIPGGRSSHADYFMAWQVDIMNAWVTNCLNARRDCHNNLLGDSRMLY